MKYFILWVLFLLVFSNSQSQEKFRIISIDFPVLGIFYSAKPGIVVSKGGATYGFGITTQYNKNLFSCEFDNSDGFWVDRNLKQYNLLYGRNLKISRHFRFEPNIGVGLFCDKYKNYETNYKFESSTTVGFPIKLKLFFLIGHKVSLGLCPSININTIATAYFTSFIVRWQFKTIK